MSANDWISGRVFNLVHGHNLVYNTCWEDPRLDREAMQLGADDTVMVITSAGCNALDYALENPQRIYAVDMNPRQNALLELKLAGIKHLEFEDFYEVFGHGYCPRIRNLYEKQLRGSLTGWSRDYWDRWIKFFENPRRPFYFRGTSGIFARLINIYLDRIVRLRPVVNELLAAQSVDEQRRIYDEQLRDRFWTRSLRFALQRDTTLSLVGVPRPQRQQVERDYSGGIFQFIQDCVEAVFAHLPIADNYFWRVYITGRYSPACCPEYLRPENFERLKAGLADKIEVHCNSVQRFLDDHDVTISRFVLLDHMDWLSTYRFAWLEDEWRAILRRAAPGARILWRSGGLRTDFVDRVQIVQPDGGRRPLSDMLIYHRDQASQLHAHDRVHTYGSFYIADLAA